MNTTANLDNNLTALGASQPEFWERLLEAPENGPVSRDEGRVLWERGLQRVPVDEDAGAIDGAAAFAALHPTVLMIGAGGGDLVVAALTAGARVVLWDRNPASLRPTLSGHDLSEAIREGRLTLCCAAELLDHAHLPRFVHPVLKVAYANELTLLARPEVPRALLVEGTLFVDDVGEALEDLGYAVFRWEIAALPVAELARIADRIGPDLVVAVNHHHGLAEACAGLGLPLVAWEIDPATDAIPRTRAPHAAMFTWRRAQVPMYRAAGYRSVHLPLAANPRRRRPATAAEAAPFTVPVAYVGSSMRARGAELLSEFIAWFAKAYEHADGVEAAARELAMSALKVQRNSGRDYVLPDVLAHAAPDLAQRLRTLGCPHRPEAMLGEAAAAEYRLRTMAQLGELGPSVWGDPGWAPLAQHGVRYRGWAGHFAQLNRIYCGAQVNVDIGRIYQLDSVPMRTFDTLACGGFLIAEHCEDLEDCFELGVEVESWKTPAELMDKCRYYLDHPERARAIADAGRTRVLRDHTIASRVARMVVSAEVHRAVA